MPLIEIDKSGELPVSVRPHELGPMVVEATLEVYRRHGFVRPWVSYLSVIHNEPVGACAFKSPPANGRVEISYFTFPGNEGQGIATDMARELVHRATTEDASVAVFAQTLPATNASTSILKKLGFRWLGVVEHPEDGTVWEWERS